MTNDEGAPNDTIQKHGPMPLPFVIRTWDFFRHLSFVIRHFPVIPP
jgi:hypothetical protein